MAYKPVLRTTSLSSAVSDAFSELQELAGEMRGWYENLTEGLQQGSTGQTVGETADALEGLSEPDVPECLADAEVKYAEQVNRDKRRGPSRSVRCENACAMLNDVVVVARDWLKENGELGAGYDDEAKDKRRDDREAVENFAGEIEEAVGSAEGCEFPSMYG